MKDSTPARFIFNKNLDARFLDELFDGDAAYAQIVFEDFLRDLPDYWKDVEMAYEKKDLNGIRTSIHKCKTLFGYVGFSDIQQLCQEFENSCSEGAFSTLHTGYQDLLHRKEEARHIIENEYDRLKIFNAADS
jgi:HPt (histidine-containing phosphotransfer) domain-containing protein